LPLSAIVDHLDDEDMLLEVLVTAGSVGLLGVVGRLTDGLLGDQAERWARGVANGRDADQPTEELTERSLGRVSCSVARRSSCRWGAGSPVTEQAEDAVVEDDKKRAAHRALVERILNGRGRASAEQRARAFGTDGLAPPLDALIDKVRSRPAQLTEADFAAARASGCTEDQLVELVICAAVGRSTRLYDAGLAALADATATGRPDSAT
jgi:hypothetical protein